MKKYKQEKVERMKALLDSKDIFYTEFDNGQLQIDGISFWATSEKWYDPKNNVRGGGFNSLMKHLKDNGAI